MNYYNHCIEVVGLPWEYVLLALKRTFKLNKIKFISYGCSRGGTVIVVFCCGDKKWKEINEFYKGLLL
jgi:hypothetical protein